MILIDQSCYLLTVLIWVSMEYLAGKGHPEGGWRGSRTVNEKERMGIWIMPQDVDDKEMWKLIFIPLHHWWIMKRFVCEYMIYLPSMRNLGSEFNYNQRDQKAHIWRLVNTEQCMNRKTKMGYNAEAKWLIWQKLILCDYFTHTVVYTKDSPEKVSAQSVKNCESLS